MARFVVRNCAIAVNNVGIEILGHLVLSDIRDNSIIQNALGGVCDRHIHLLPLRQPN